MKNQFVEPSDGTGVSINSEFSADGVVVVTTSAVLPTYSLDQIADQLTDGYWTYNSTVRHSFAVAPGGTLTVDISALNSDGQFFALKALEAWTMVTGINFQTVVGGADITFDDEDSGAYAQSTYSGNTISSSFVNISKAWILGDEGNLNSYSFQTYMHEIGHAMGLGHAGNYNGSASYAEDGTGDNHYLNDSWQATLMSYFAQWENTTIDATYAYTMTPMIADILAMQNLYGVAGTLRTGDTTYGENSTAGGYYDMLATPTFAFTLIDDGGIDTIDFSSSTFNQKVNLNAEGISDVWGLTGNMQIARGSVIENFFSGSGHDYIVGNAAENFIKGGSGRDRILGGDGNDQLAGNSGRDVLRGEAGDDVLYGGAYSDRLYGGADHDTLYGGAGNDTLKGGRGRDRLYGGDGDDMLYGGLGVDIMTGGAGADTFVFDNENHSGKFFMADIITDFTHGEDTIDIGDLFAGAASYIGTSGFSGTGSSEVRVTENNGNTTVRVDVDGDGLVDFVLRLTDTTGVTADDFIL